MDYTANTTELTFSGRGFADDEYGHLSVGLVHGGHYTPGLTYEVGVGPCDQWRSLPLRAVALLGRKATGAGDADGQW